MVWVGHLWPKWWGSYDKVRHRDGASYSYLCFCIIPALMHTFWHAIPTIFFFIFKIAHPKILLLLSHGCIY